MSNDRRQRATIWALAAIAAVIMSGAVAASDPIGIYCVVSRVVLTPDEISPETVQIWGACSAATGGMTDERPYVPGWYSDPQVGYLHYRAPAGKSELARREWLDLKRVAGTGQVVGFGCRGCPPGRLRWPDERVAAPDVYPLHMGVTIITNSWQRTRDSYYNLFTALRAAAGVK
jgi:hypothetical protein